MKHTTPGEAPVSPAAARSYSAPESWIMAIFLPSTATFRALLADPAASRKRAYLWVVAATLLPYLLIIFRARTGIPPGVGGLQPLALDMATRLLAGLLGLELLAAPTHLTCGFLGGSAPYARLEYAFATWYAPLLLIAGLPVFRASGAGGFSPLTIYGVLLGVLGVRAVYSFGWGKALAGMLIWPLILLLLLRQGASFFAL